MYFCSWPGAVLSGLRAGQITDGEAGRLENLQTALSASGLVSGLVSGLAGAGAGAVAGLVQDCSCPGNLCPGTRARHQLHQLQWCHRTRGPSRGWLGWAFGIPRPTKAPT